MDDASVLFLIGIISAAGSLVGVALGGWITSYNTRVERRREWSLKQLDEFYSPMLGIRERIRAKSESRLAVSQAASAAWQQLFDGASIEQQLKLQKESECQFDAIIQYDNRVLAEELLPLYGKMVSLFSDKMGLAEPTTRAHFASLVHFVDIWERSQSGSMPGEVLAQIGHKESTLYPFYNDLVENIARIQAELRR